MRRLRRDRSPRHIVTREINTYRSLSFQPRFRCAPRSQRPPFQFLSHYFSHISRRFIEMKSRNRILPNEEEIDTFFFSPLFFFVFSLPSKKLVEESIELIEERKERERERERTAWSRRVFNVRWTRGAPEVIGLSRGRGTIKLLRELA